MSIHDKHEQNSGGWFPVVRVAWKYILSQVEGSGGSLESFAVGDCQVRSMPGTYKVEWQDDETDDILTLYDDGVWTLDTAKGSVEGKVTPLHHKTWVRRLIKAGVHHGIAYCAVDYFKQLLERK